jgi:hypothetical protein
MTISGTNSDSDAAGFVDTDALRPMYHLISLQKSNGWDAVTSHVDDVYVHGHCHSRYYGLTNLNLWSTEQISLDHLPRLIRNDSLGLTNDRHHHLRLRLPQLSLRLTRRPPRPAQTKSSAKLTDVLALIKKLRRTRDGSSCSSGTAMLLLVAPEGNRDIYVSVDRNKLGAESNKTYDRN